MDLKIHCPRVNQKQMEKYGSTQCGTRNVMLQALSLIGWHKYKEKWTKNGVSEIHLSIKKNEQTLKVF